MYDHDNFQYSVDLCPRGNDSSFSLLDLQNGFFMERQIYDAKPEGITQPSRKKQDQCVQNLRENQQQQAGVEQESQNSRGNVKIIECCASKLFRLQKFKRGRAKEGKNISQIFKTETLFYLGMLAEFRILNEQEKSWVHQFKQESLSTASFLKLIKKQKIRRKIKEFYQSGEFAQRILTTPRISFSRKIQVIKYINFGSSLLSKPDDNQKRNQ